MSHELPVVKLDPHALLQANTCVHCGFCLPACPTYRELGEEMDSPRGRIYLMKALHEGRIPLSETAVKHIDLCLDCRACETACPSGVGYGSIVETVRGQIEPKVQRPWYTRLIRRFFFDTVFPSPGWLAFLGSLTRFAQKTGLTKLAGILPKPMAAMAPVLPEIAPRPSREALPGRLPAHGRRRGTAVLHVGCIMDVMFAGTNAATARLLQRAGYEVLILQASACCGSLHKDVGEAERTRDLAKRNIQSFERSGADLLVSNAAGCGAHLKAYHLFFQDDPAWYERARAFTLKVKDLSEVLFEAQLPPPPREFPRRVVYQDACHLAHGQGVSRPPRELLRQVPGIELVEMPDSDACCGSAGVYNVTHYDVSMQVLDRKMGNVLSVAPEVLVTPNPGCFLQLKLGARRSGSNLEVYHIADFLDQLYADS